jgi:hypothetical protein
MMLIVTAAPVVFPRRLVKVAEDDLPDLVVSQRRLLGPF